ncbi:MULTISPECIES: hypothetical protein [Vagococcus]|uniref:Uncharacterized protein n=1 Tax=Vagococcus fluvialis bH819 TaxID=1255619 RepID=A0A1X6WMC2_9ENTE|nr:MULTISPECIES: hypothetical protein [Vagococcus]SLM85382.1 hypothetical protein FM121_04740 [Vagococcus fluvialis bH819]HCM89322.1 hypothetical protein [Vagococcus sp.]
MENDNDIDLELKYILKTELNDRIILYEKEFKENNLFYILGNIFVPFYLAESWPREISEREKSDFSILDKKYSDLILVKKYIWDELKNDVFGANEENSRYELLKKINIYYSFFYEKKTIKKYMDKIKGFQNETLKKLWRMNLLARSLYLLGNQLELNIETEEYTIRYKKSKTFMMVISEDKNIQQAKNKNFPYDEYHYEKIVKKMIIELDKSFNNNQIELQEQMSLLEITGNNLSLPQRIVAELSRIRTNNDSNKLKYNLESKCIAAMRIENDDKTYLSISGAKRNLEIDAEKIFKKITDNCINKYEYVKLNTSTRYYMCSLENDYINLADYENANSAAILLNDDKRNKGKLFACCEKKLLSMKLENISIKDDDSHIFVKFQPCKRCITMKENLHFICNIDSLLECSGTGQEVDTSPLDKTALKIVIYRDRY